MTNLVFDPPAVQSIPVGDGAEAYPIHRIFCVGRNYDAHAAEMGAVADREAPFYFTKNPQAAVMTGATIPYPLGTQNYHHEMELAFAISKPTFRVTAADALDHVYGYCCALDMTRRDLQNVAKEKRRPWDTSKDFENAAIFAPMTRAAEAGDIPSKRMQMSVNGQLRQDTLLSLMIHDVPGIIADLSRLYHLGPGDVILTGTPAGVGPVVAGDVIEGTIEGLAPISLTIGPAE